MGLTARRRGPQPPCHPRGASSKHGGQPDSLGLRGNNGFGRKTSPCPLDDTNCVPKHTKAGKVLPSERHTRVPTGRHAHTDTSCSQGHPPPPHSLWCCRPGPLPHSRQARVWNTSLGTCSLVPTIPSLRSSD